MSLPVIAIVQCPDSGPLESLVEMFDAIGIECKIPNADVKAEIRRIGHTYVVDIDSLVRGMGYDQPMKLSEANSNDMRRDDVVYVDIKAHQHYERLVTRWPNFNGKILWYRIQGGKPEHVIRADGFDCGDEANPPCPILTPNQWYQDIFEDHPPIGESSTACHKPNPWGSRTYTCWPPFYRFDDYYTKYRRSTAVYSRPVCLTHNLTGWGYGDLINRCVNLGVRCYGRGSPQGLISHHQVPQLLSECSCLIHLKSSDAPGYSLYEALAAGCPIICSRRLIWRNRMQELFIPGETCLVFDRETHDPLSPEEVNSCEQEIKDAMGRLENPTENMRIGLNGRDKLRLLMWNKDRSNDVESLRQFFQRNFP